ncbi:unnamed protein product [Eruca vesicaria subsp. sativa]|uniref:Uncharacterized protein n=1 Tax=Eruca vesicaria subsp. sativa TaxID=29727 RepID=A0ABC8JRV3_ERUVS|nr:unnamed protein product [Eruca vesicaria subsp. sativa]
MEVYEVASGLKELDMDNYDNEDDEFNSSALGLGIFSNELDPYMNDAAKYKEGSHTNSVLGLAWNKEFRASEAPTERLRFGMWLLANVQAVACNHYAPEVLLSGKIEDSLHTRVSLEDGTVKSFDIRAAQSGSDSDLRQSFTIQAHDQDKGFSISYNFLPLMSYI